MELSKSECNWKDWEVWVKKKKAIHFFLQYLPCPQRREKTVLHAYHSKDEYPWCKSKWHSHPTASTFGKSSLKNKQNTPTSSGRCTHLETNDSQWMKTWSFLGRSYQVANGWSLYKALQLYGQPLVPMPRSMFLSLEEAACYFQRGVGLFSELNDWMWVLC